MKSFSTCFLFALLLEFQVAASPIPQPRQRAQLTRLAHYNAGAYVSKDGRFLRVNIDKQLGGTVSIQLSDADGASFFEKILTPLDTTVRLNINLTELAEGMYQLAISNGLDTDVRTLKISSPKPAHPTRTITPL
ncbi:hypothetical protein WBJ53_09900 [Spirosoma sp. SC4-14]|uniref:hypothetical protein n=1 Tax=Spirosoma sp. SC4-14 TaxID=3128900 RepID=UPI0030CFE2E5